MKSTGVFFGLAWAVLLGGCSDSIWNAGDLAKWVRQQATEQGCIEESIDLEEWYQEDASGNHWHGSCTDSSTGKKKQFSINVDSVWTPSG